MERLALLCEPLEATDVIVTGNELLRESLVDSS